MRRAHSQERGKIKAKEGTFRLFKLIICFPVFILVINSNILLIKGQNSTQEGNSRSKEKKTELRNFFRPLRFRPLRILDFVKTSTNFISKDIHIILTWDCWKRSEILVPKKSAPWYKYFWSNRALKSKIQKGMFTAFRPLRSSFWPVTFFAFVKT